MAAEEYEQGLRYLIFMPHPEPQQVPHIQEASAACHLNLAAVNLRMGREKTAIKHAEDCLKLRPDDTKAHYRLGQVWGVPPAPAPAPATRQAPARGRHPELPCCPFRPQAPAPAHFAGRRLPATGIPSHRLPHRPNRQSGLFHLLTRPGGACGGASAPPLPPPPAAPPLSRAPGLQPARRLPEGDQAPLTCGEARSRRRRIDQRDRQGA